MKRLPWRQNSGAVTFIFIFLLGEGAIYQHQHVCAPSLTTTILPSYFKKILATNNIVLTLFYLAHRYAIFLCSLDVEILIIITKSQRQYKDYQVGQLANYYLANNQNFAKFVISGQINQSQKW